MFFSVIQNAGAMMSRQRFDPLAIEADPASGTGQALTTVNG
jgi:hypothetical protein